MRLVRASALAFALMPAAALAQTASLDDVAAAIGVHKVDTLEFTATGKFYSIGQSERAGEAWPAADLVRLVRAMDYKAGAVRENEVVAIANNPYRGGGGVPMTGERDRTFGIHNNQAWAMIGPGAAQASPGLAPTLVHDLWTDPVGIVKAAIEDKATVNGGTFAIDRPGRLKARATVNRQNLVEKVESWVGNTVLGDMAVVTTFADYKDFNGVKYPTRITRMAGGFPSLEATVREVKINAGAVAAPQNIAAATNDVKVDKAANGVWHLTGGSHHSVAIEMPDHVILFEAPLGDGRANAVIDAVKKTIPNKPIRSVVASHHHFDHSGGLRAVAAEDATIVTHESAAPYLQQAYTAPRSLTPDKLSRSGKTAKFQTVGDKLVLGSGARTFEVHHVKGQSHVHGMLVGYLPKEKILMVADSFSPRAPVTKVPDQLNPNAVNLWFNVVTLNLDVDTVLPIHGRMVKVQELKYEAGVAN